MSMQKSFQKLLVSSVISLALSGSAFAAQVPAGVALANKQEIKLHATAEVATLDPQKIDETGAGLIAHQLFEGLVETDSEGNLVPGVAERWESTPDFKVWTYHLRHNAKWSNGDPVTAHDFVYAWQRLVDPKTASTYASYLDFMKVENVNEILEGKKPITDLGVKALDDYTFQVTLTESVPFAPDLTPNSALYPVHKATIEKYGEDWTTPEHLVGNGAYTLSERILNEKATLVRNPQYWNNKETVIEKASYVIATESAGIARYRAGDLDMSYVPSTNYRDPKFMKEYGSQIHKSRKLGTFTYLMNNVKAPFNDIRVRKAFDLSLDRDIITDKVLGFGQIPTFTYTPNYIADGNKIQQPEYASWTQAQRNEEAKKLLTEAGYSKSNPLKVELLYNTNEGLKAISLAASSMWKKNLDGLVEITLKNQEWKTFLETKHQGNFTIAFDAWIADYNEASTFLTVFLSTNENNKSGFKNAKFDELVNAAYKAKSADERQTIYAEAEAELDRHHPFVAVYHYAGMFIKNPKLKGYEGKDPMGSYAIKDLYLEK